MKKTGLNNIARKFFAGSILATVLFLTAQNKVFANTEVKNTIQTEKGLAEKASVKYVGSSNENLLFHVNYTNVNAKAFSIVVTDENGEAIYTTVVNEKNFDKTFALPKSLDLNKISFTIKSNEGVYHQSFSLNVKTVEVTDVVAKNN
jgi:hypothetical protein